MHRIIVFLFIFSLLFCSFGCQKNYTHGVFQITFTPYLIYNDGVGNEWSITYTCDDETIHSGDKLTVPLNPVQTKTIDIKITEFDKWDDVAYASLAVDLKDGFENSCNVTVYEFNTRSNFNIAKWKISCQVNLVKKLYK